MHLSAGLLHLVNMKKETTELTEVPIKEIIQNQWDHFKGFKRPHGNPVWPNQKRMHNALNTALRNGDIKGRFVSPRRAVVDLSSAEDWLLDYTAEAVSKGHVRRNEKNKKHTKKFQKDRGNSYVLTAKGTILKVDNSKKFKTAGDAALAALAECGATLYKAVGDKLVPVTPERKENKDA